MSVCISAGSISIPAFCTSNLIASGTISGSGASSNNVLFSAPADGFYIVLIGGGVGQTGGQISFTIAGTAVTFNQTSTGGIIVEYYNLTSGQNVKYSSTDPGGYSFPYSIYQM